ncbi:MAG TPA: hypothetical protein VFA70_15715 [Dehalococcoidia bacterium]|nr:hypothetical protein [Dehalococcoidia bacterium]
MSEQGPTWELVGRKPSPTDTLSTAEARAYLQRQRLGVVARLAQALESFQWVRTPEGEANDRR